MFKKSLILLALSAAAFGVHAQSSPAKKEVVNKILKLQQPAIEALSRNLVEQSAQQLLARAAPALQQRVPQDKQEAMAKEIEGEARKYVTDTVPIVRDRALKLAPTTVGAILEEKFTEDELKQVLAIIESPVYAKFQAAGGDLQNALTEKLVAETRPAVEAKLRAFEETVAKKLGIPAQGAAPAGGPPAAAAAPAGKAPVKK